MRSPEAVPGAGWQRHGLGREESGRAHFQLQVAAGEALQSLALAPCGARVPQRPHLGSDQGLKAGLEVVEPAVVEPRHLIQELLVLGLEVVPHRPQLFSGLESKTSGSGLLVVDLASTLGARCVCWGWVGGEHWNICALLPQPRSWSPGGGGLAAGSHRARCPYPLLPSLGTWWSLASTGPVFSFSSYFSTLACSLR